MNTSLSDFDPVHLLGEDATHPLARPCARLALSFLLAGMSLPRRRFAPSAHSNAPSGAFKYGF
jgi:hypothetical protein